MEKRRTCKNKGIVGEINTTTKARFPLNSVPEGTRPESHCRVFLPYDDAYEQDEDEDNDGGHDAVLVHPARQTGRKHFRKT